MRLGLICPSPSDATSFYRAHGVFSHLPGVEIVTHNWWSWEQVLTVDALFFQRVCEPEPLKLIQLAKKLHKPVWVDYDDDLFRVPTLKNPFWDSYSRPNVRSNMAEIINAADLVTTTNAFLRWGLQSGAGAPKESEPKFVDVPNAFNDFIWQSQDVSRNKIVAWRGSVTHYADMEPYIPAMADCAKSHADWQWVFFGSPHWGIESIPGASVFSHSDVFHYMEVFQNTAPGIVIVPLIDHEFNRAKSEIAALEGIMVGAIIVAPHWPQWNIPGVINYNCNPSGFRDALSKAMDMGDEERAKAHEASRAWVTKNRLLSNVNKQRQSLLERLTSGCKFANVRRPDHALVADV